MTVDSLIVLSFTLSRCCRLIFHLVLDSQHGEVQCRPVECPELPCKHPVNITGQCCQSCLSKRVQASVGARLSLLFCPTGHCLFYGAFYDHGELVTIKKCVECECQDGSMQCTRIDPETMCPKLTCPPDEQFSVADNCCKFCPGTVLVVTN
jgi:hypothetical protein